MCHIPTTLAYTKLLELTYNLELTSLRLLMSKVSHESREAEEKFSSSSLLW